MRSTRAITNEGAATATPLGAFFAARIAITLICARWLGLDPQVGAAVQILLGTALFLIVCFHRLGSSAVVSCARLPGGPTRWVLAFLLYSLLSFGWTGAVSPSVSFVYWWALAVDVATVLLLLRDANPSLPIKSLLRGYLYASCVLAVLAWIMPVQEDLRLGDMDFFNTNQIGNLCAFAFFFAQYLERSDGQRWTLIKIFLLITLLRSLSKTALVAMLVSQCIFFLRDNSASRVRKTWTILGALLVGAIFWGLFTAYFTIYTSTGNQAETLTGRTAIWAFAFDSSLAKPWFGNGFDALWHVIPPLGPDRFEARHAENEILQQFFAYGSVGLVLLIGLYGSFLRLTRRIHEHSVRLVLQSLLLYVLVRGLAEAEPFDLLLPLWSIVLFSTISIDSSTGLLAKEATVLNEFDFRATEGT